MEQKIRATTYNIVMLQFSSVFMLPIVWILFGSIFEWVFIEFETLTILEVKLFYYVGLIGSYYVGLKHAFSYISKNIIVTKPKTTGKISSFIFLFGLVSVYYILYKFSKEYDYFRMLAFMILGYLYTFMTYKYFNTFIIDNKIMEYSFLHQVLFTIINLSVVMVVGISVSLIIWFIKDYKWSYYIYILIAPLVLLAITKHTNKINKVFFIPYFYKKGDTFPLNKICILLAITIPINIILFYIVYNELQF